MSLKVKERRRARLHAVQALYQQDMAGNSSAELKRQYYADNVNRHPVDWEFFNNLIDGIDEYTDELDDKIKPLVDRDFKSINPIELAILRLGVYELLFRLDVPYQVVIKEYTSNADNLGAEDGHKFINSLLDKIAKDNRKI
ncbi:MAG: N utilization substance protein B [Francisellaceae bacterium]|jgi:N utilization substance protein B